jgi:hypothetical protein
MNNDARPQGIKFASSCSVRLAISTCREFNLSYSTIETVLVLSRPLRGKLIPQINTLELRKLQIVARCAAMLAWYDARLPRILMAGQLRPYLFELKIDATIFQVGESERMLITAISDYVRLNHLGQKYSTIQHLVP